MSWWVGLGPPCVIHDVHGAPKAINIHHPQGQKTWLSPTIPSHSRFMALDFPHWKNSRFRTLRSSEQAWVEYHFCPYQLQHAATRFFLDVPMIFHGWIWGKICRKAQILCWNLRVSCFWYYFLHWIIGVILVCLSSPFYNPQLMVQSLNPIVNPLHPHPWPWFICEIPFFEVKLYAKSRKMMLNHVQSHDWCVKSHSTVVKSHVVVSGLSTVPITAGGL